MPMVPQFGREDLPEAQSTGPQADVAEAGIPGEALARLGQAGVDEYSKIIDRENFDYTQTNIAGARTQWTNEYLKRGNAAQQSGNYDGLASGLSNDMQADLQQRIAGAPTPHAADLLKKTFANLQDEFATKASLFEGAGHREVAKGNVGTSLDNLAPIPYRDPSQATSVYGEGLGIIHGGVAAGLNAGDAQLMGQAWKNRVFGAEAQNYLENSPQRLSAELRAGKFDTLLSEDQIVQYQNQADRAVKAQQVEAQRVVDERAMMMRGSVDQSVNDNLASIADTGRPAVVLTRGQLAAAYPNDPDRVNGILAEIGRAQTGYVAKQQVALNSPADDAALLTKMMPSGAGYADQAQTYNSIVAAVQAKRQALSSDPAAYVQGASPQVQGLFQAAWKDPTKLPQAVAAQDAAYDRLGIPADQRAVLPAPVAASEVARLKALDPAKADVGAALSGMAKSYGDAWPRVFADLVKAKLPPGYETLATMDTPQQLAGRQDMQRALAVAAQRGGPKALADDVPPEAATAIKAGLPDQMAEFRQTAAIPGASSNVGLIAKVGDSVALLAHTYALQGQDGPTALKNAYDAIIGDKYDFDGSMRVPKGMLPQMQAATTQLAAALKPQDLQASAGLPPGIAADRWASARKNSAWYPMQHDDGLMMMVQTRDGRWSRVLRADGSPVQVLFKDAVKAAPPGAAPDADPAMPDGP